MDKIHQVCYALSLNRPTNYLLRERVQELTWKHQMEYFLYHLDIIHIHIQATDEMSLEKRGWKREATETWWLTWWIKLIVFQFAFVLRLQQQRNFLLVENMRNR